MTERQLGVAGRRLAFSVPPAADRLFAAQFPGAVEADRQEPSHRFALALSEGYWTVHRDGRQLARRAELGEAIQTLDFQVQRALLRLLTDRVCLHAGCVEVGGRAVLLAGSQERGKTATTLQLIEMGHGFLCEEIAPVAPGSLEVEPFARGLGVTEAYIEELQRHYPLVAGRVEKLGAGEARYVPRRIVDQSVIAEWILLPRFDPQAVPEIQRLRPTEALTEILGYCFEPAMEIERVYDTVLSLVNGCSLARLTYADPPSARRLLGELLGGA